MKKLREIISQLFVMFAVEFVRDYHVFKRIHDFMFRC